MTQETGTTHIMAFTYDPKILPVLKGKCRQTIRLIGKRPKKPGDKVIFHGWESRPYFSAWTWRMTVTINYVQDIMIYEDGIDLFPSGDDDSFLPWGDPNMNEIAELDFIKPPTGTALGELFNKMHKLDGGVPFQIIRW